MFYFQHFKVTKPCQLVIFNKNEQKVFENLEDKSNCFVCHLKYTSPCVLLLQTDTEDNGSLLATPGCKNYFSYLFLLD